MKEDKICWMKGGGEGWRVDDGGRMLAGGEGWSHEDGGWKMEEDCWMEGGRWKKYVGLRVDDGGWKM